MTRSQVLWAFGLLAASTTLHGAEPLTAEAAKTALLQMMRSKAGQEINWFRGEAPDRLAKMPVRPGEKGWFAWGAFQIHPESSKYTFTIAPRDENSPACTFIYAGKLVEKDGGWSATIPQESQILTPALP